MKTIIIALLFFTSIMYSQGSNWTASIKKNGVKKVSITKHSYKFGEPDLKGSFYSDTIYNLNFQPILYNTNSINSKVSIYYDDNGNVEKTNNFSTDRNTNEEIENLGFAFKNRYDEKNNLIETVQYGSSGRLMKKTENEYNNLGKKNKTKITSNIQVIQYTFKYDNLNRLSELSIDGQNKKELKQYKYNSVGQLIEIITNPQSLITEKTTYKYDSQGWITEEISRSVSEQEIEVNRTKGKDIVTAKYKYEYNDKGLLVGKIEYDVTTMEPNVYYKFQYEF